ncbi:MAG: TetR/AcrR family transcriptional regulator [Cognatishimia sp.]
MKEAKKQERHTQIAECAYAVLKESGYAGASLLNIAKAAKASNETLYRWYGGKVGLFEILVQDNAAETRQRLETAIASNANPIETLEAIAPVLLSMVLGERAVLLNRAAAADPSGDLGRAIAQNGREVIAPLIGRVVSQFSKDTEHDPADVAETFVGLLIGDQQIRRVIGVIPEPNSDYIERRADIAVKQIVQLYN